MTVFAIDGFKWRTTIAGVEARNFAQFKVPETYNPHVTVGDGSLHIGHLNTTITLTAQLPTRKTFKGPRICIGFRGNLNDTIYAAKSAIALTNCTPSDIGNYGAQATLSEVGDDPETANQLPVLLLQTSYNRPGDASYLNPSTNGIRLLSTLRMKQTDMESVLLRHVRRNAFDLFKTAYYEIMYNMDADTIGLWVNGIHVLELPYFFTHTQRTSEYHFVLKAHRGSGGNNSYTGRIRIQDFYVADERLGSIQVKQVQPNSDYFVDEKFGETVQHTTLSASAGTVGPTVGISLARILFGFPAVTDVGIKAVSLSARFNAGARQSNEFLPAIALSYRTEGITRELGVHNMDVSSYAMLSTTFTKNPISGVDWTPELVSSLKIGAYIAAVRE